MRSFFCNWTAFAEFSAAFLYGPVDFYSVFVPASKNGFIVSLSQQNGIFAFTKTHNTSEWWIFCCCCSSKRCRLHCSCLHHFFILPSLLPHSGTKIVQSARSTTRRCSHALESLHANSLTVCSQFCCRCLKSLSSVSCLSLFLWTEEGCIAFCLLQFSPFPLPGFPLDISSFSNLRAPTRPFLLCKSSASPALAFQFQSCRCPCQTIFCFLSLLSWRRL
jgi:hypothetical protein